MFLSNNSTVIKNDINIAFIGADSVGKSALIVRFITNRFIGVYDSGKRVEVISKKRK